MISGGYWGVVVMIVRVNMNVVVVSLRDLLAWVQSQLVGGASGQDQDQVLSSPHHQVGFFF